MNHIPWDSNGMLPSSETCPLRFPGSLPTAPCLTAHGSLSHCPRLLLLTAPAFVISGCAARSFPDFRLHRMLIASRSHGPHICSTWSTHLVHMVHNIGPHGPHGPPLLAWSSMSLGLGNPTPEPCRTTHGSCSGSCSSRLLLTAPTPAPAPAPDGPLIYPHGSCSRRLACTNQ